MLGPCIITREFMNQVKERGVDDAHIIFINAYVYNCTYFTVYTITEREVMLLFHKVVLTFIVLLNLQ